MNISRLSVTHKLYNIETSHIPYTFCSKYYYNSLRYENLFLFCK